MRIDTVRTLLKTRPFEPFRMFLPDGKTYDITHPDFMWITASDAQIGTREKSADGEIERFHIIDVFLVSRIEPLPMSHPVGGNFDVNGTI